MNNRGGENYWPDYTVPQYTDRNKFIHRCDEEAKYYMSCRAVLELATPIIT